MWMNLASLVLAFQAITSTRAPNGAVPLRSPRPLASAPSTYAHVSPDHTSGEDPSKLPLVQWTLAIVQILGFGALVVYVWKTWDIAKATRDAAKASASSIVEMRAAREAASAPHVAIYFSAASAQFAEIVLENFGDGTAADVACDFNPPLQSTLNGDPAQFFSVPKWLPPRSRLSHGFDTWMRYLKSDLPRKYDVHVRYKDVSRTKEYSLEYVLDVSSFEHMLKWEQKGTHDLVKVADAARNQLQRILDDANSREDSRDRVGELLPLSANMDEAVAMILAYWDLLQAATNAASATPFDHPYRSVMKRAAASAFAASLYQRRSETDRNLVQNVFVALHNHTFDILTDHAPAREALAQAVQALRDGWSFGLGSGAPSS